MPQHILLTGANGYIGQRLLPELLQSGCKVTAVVRDVRRFRIPEHYADQVNAVEADLLDPDSLTALPADVDAAYYLVHSMGGARDFADLDARAAHNFVEYADRSRLRHVIYLSGIVNDDRLSKHLDSRLEVERILSGARAHLTALRSAIVIGSGSASFEILRDLVEKLPVMITPAWVNTRCQPIAIRDVVYYLNQVRLAPEAYGRSFDIGGPDVLSYRDMMLGYARVRGLSRWIATVPVMTPRLSSYWLYFITSTSYRLAQSLVDSMKNEVVCRERDIDDIAPRQCLSYETALRNALSRVENEQVLSSWKDSAVSGYLSSKYLDFVHVPRRGVFIDRQRQPIGASVEKARESLWSIGGKNGWLYMNWAWSIRGFIDQLVGGVGLRRGRRSPTELRIGDAVDFWRVLIADANRSRLTLFAEMKLPGEAWLEFEIEREGDRAYLKQTATFRPKGLLGRLYWYAMIPAHLFIFRGMARAIANP